MKLAVGSFLAPFNVQTLTSDRFLFVANGANGCASALADGDGDDDSQCGTRRSPIELQ